MGDYYLEGRDHELGEDPIPDLDEIEAAETRRLRGLGRKLGAALLSEGFRLERNHQFQRGTADHIWHPDLEVGDPDATYYDNVGTYAALAVFDEAHDIPRIPNPNNPDELVVDPDALKDIGHGIRGKMAEHKSFEDYS